MAENEIERKGENSPKESDLDWLDEADLWDDERSSEKKSEDSKKDEQEPSALRGLTTFLSGMVDEYKDRFLGKGEVPAAKGAAEAGVAKGAAEVGAAAAAKGAAEVGAAAAAKVAAEVGAAGAAKGAAESGESTAKSEAKGKDESDENEGTEQDQTKKDISTGKALVTAFTALSNFVANPMTTIARGLAPDPEVERHENAFANLQVNNGVVEEVTTPQGTFRHAGTDKDGKDKYVHIKPGADDEGQEFKGSVSLKDGRLVVSSESTGKSHEYAPRPVKYENLSVSKEGKVDTLETPERSYRYIGPGADGKDQYLVTTPQDQEGRLLNGNVTVKDGKVSITDKDSGVTHEYRNTEPPKDNAYDATRRLTVNATRAIAGDGAAKSVDDAFKDPAKIQKWYNDASERAKAAEAKAGEAKGAGSGDAPKGEAKGAGSGDAPKGEAKGPGEVAKAETKAPADALKPEPKPGQPGEDGKPLTTTVEKPVVQSVIPDSKSTTIGLDGKPTTTIGTDGKPSTTDGKPVTVDPSKTTLDAEKGPMPRVETPAATTIGDQIKGVNPLVDGSKTPTAQLDASKVPGTLPADHSLLAPSLVQNKDAHMAPSVMADNVSTRPGIDAKSVSDSKSATTGPLSAEASRSHDLAKEAIDGRSHNNLSEHRDSPTTNLAQFQAGDKANFAVKGADTKAAESPSGDRHADGRPFNSSSLNPSGLERSSLVNPTTAKSLDGVTPNQLSTKAQIEAVSKPPAEAVNKMLPQLNSPTAKDQILPVNMSTNKAVDLPGALRTDAVTSKSESGRAQLDALAGKDPLTGKVIQTDSRQPGPSSANTLGGPNSALNSNRVQDGGVTGKNAGPTGSASIREGIQGGKAEQSGLIPAGARLGMDAAGQLRIDPVTGRAIRAEAGVTTAGVTGIGINGITGSRNEVGAGAISLTNTTRRSQEGHYMIAEMTLAVVLAAGGIRRVLPTDRSGREGGPGTGSGDRTRQIERELGKLREPARVDSLKFVSSTFKINCIQKDMLASGIKANLASAQLQSGRNLHLGSQGAGAFLMAVGQYREAKALTSQHRPQEQIAIGYTQAQLVPLMADAGAGRNFAMPVEPSALDKLFKAQQMAMDEILRPLLNAQDFIEMNDPFESFKNAFAAKVKRRPGAAAGAEGLEKQSAGGDGDDDGDDEEEPKNVVLLRPTWLISPGETLLSIAEEQYSDPYIAWLIADLNKGNCQEHWMDGKRIVEFHSRQKITLPVWQDIVEFYGSMPATARPENLVTIVATTEIDREVVDSVLGPIVGNKSKFNSPQATGDSEPKLAEKIESSSSQDAGTLVTQS